MKKLLKRVLGITASVSLLVTSSLTAWAEEPTPGHSHTGGTVIDDKSGAYTITLTHSDGKTEFTTDSLYGAYQIFSGTVKGEDYPSTPSLDDHPENPGTEGTAIPITDIKWGNAFGIVGENKATQVTIDKAIVGFVIALAGAPTGTYKYAFSDFNGFDVVQKDDGTNKNDAFIKKGSDGKTYLADRFVTGGTNIDETSADFSAVNFDKLAVAVADVLTKEEHTEDHEWLEAFTDILGGYAQNPDGGYLNAGYVSRYYAGKKNDSDSKKYEITVPAGYYMIRDLSTIGTSETDKSYSARMLFVANNVNQVLKEGVPKLDKKVLRDTAAVGTAGNETDAAGVGDVVHFQLKGTLPSNYELYLGGYQYTFEDTLSGGLDLVQYADNHADYGTDANACVNVTVKGLFKWNASASGGTGDWVWEDKTITLDNILKSITSPDGATSSDHHLGTDGDKANYNYDATYNKETHLLNVYFPCLREIRISEDDAIYRLGYNSDTKSSEIFLDYYAKVNENAVVSPAAGDVLNGNYNQADIKYSDNPQSYGDTDTTTIDRATVYTFGLDIVKIDAAQYLRDNGKTNDSALAGAKFAVVRQKAGTTSTDTEWEIAKFTQIDPNLDSTENLPEIFKDFGYYSVVSWESITDDKDESVKSENFDAKWLEISKYNDYNIETLTDGVLNISGLDDGVTYTIVETEPPTPDYAKIDPFTVTLTAAKDDDTAEYNGKLESAEVSDTIKDGESFSFDNPVDITDTFGDTNNGSANMLVANFKYIDLPSTGGVGTIWFYIFGVAGIALSGVLFFLSKKKVTR